MLYLIVKMLDAIVCLHERIEPTFPTVDRRHHIRASTQSLRLTCSLLNITFL